MKQLEVLGKQFGEDLSRKEYKSLNALDRRSLAVWHSSSSALLNSPWAHRCEPVAQSRISSLTQELRSNMRGELIHWNASRGIR